MKKNNFYTLLWRLAVFGLLVGWAMPEAIAQCGNVNNGSMNGTVWNVPAGWVDNSPLGYIVLQNTVYANTITPSPDGGTFLLFASYGEDGDAIAGTTLSGLTAGSIYTLSWYSIVAPFLDNASNTSADYLVEIDGITLPFSTLGATWESESYAFVANSSVATVKIILPGVFGSSKDKMLIDGVSITCGGTLPTCTAYVSDDLIDVSTGSAQNYKVYSPSALNINVVTNSPAGGFGTYFASFGSGNDAIGTTTITGLTAGDTFTVSWFGAVEPMQGGATNTDAFYYVKINGASLPYTTNGPAWEAESYGFVATDTTATLEFNFPGVAGGSQDRMLIDGISIECVLLEVCNNGIDDDGDGQIDCADGDCAPNIYCTCTSNVIAGNANTVFSQTSVGNSGNNTLGVPDGQRSNMNASADELILQLSDIVLDGREVIFTGLTTNSGNTLKLEQSMDGSSFSNLQSFNFSAANSSEDIAYMLSGSDAEYIRITITRVGGGIEVDALSYEFCDEPPCTLVLPTFIK